MVCSRCGSTRKVPRCNCKIKRHFFIEILASGAAAQGQVGWDRSTQSLCNVHNTLNGAQECKHNSACYKHWVVRCRVSS